MTQWRQEVTSQEYGIRQWRINRIIYYVPFPRSPVMIQTLQCRAVDLIIGASEITCCFPPAAAQTGQSTRRARCPGNKQLISVPSRLILHLRLDGVCCRSQGARGLFSIRRVLFGVFGTRRVFEHLGFHVVFLLFLLGEE